jgi:polar amino acid transport system substrate-binding protein
MNYVFTVLTQVLQLCLFSLILTNDILAEPIIINANREYYPSTYIRGNEWEGMDIDIIKEIFLRAKLDYKILEIPFKRSLFWMKSGKTHMMPNLTKNKKRSAYMNWLGPIRITGIGLVVLKKNQNLPIITCDDLKLVFQQHKRKFGYVNGASYSEYFDNRLKNDPALNKVMHFTLRAKQNIVMLQKGRIIGFFQDDFEVQHLLLDQSKKRDRQYDGVVLHPYRIEGSVGGAFIGISKKLDKISYQKIIAAFQSMKDDGTFNRIHLKWIGKEG